MRGVRRRLSETGYFTRFFLDGIKEELTRYGARFGEIRRTPRMIFFFQRFIAFALRSTLYCASSAFTKASMETFFITAPV